MLSGNSIHISQAGSYRQYQLKWIIRKLNGEWWVWRPDRDSLSSIGFHPPLRFNSFASLQDWRPDCDRFLAGYCSCRLECGAG